MLNEPNRWLSRGTSSWMEQFRRDIDGLFDRFLGDCSDSDQSRTSTRWPAIESFSRDGNWIMRVELPGVDPKDIDVSAVGNMLTIRASRERRDENRAQNYGHQELSYGTFERSVTLPSGVKNEQIKANYQNGVLELTVPVPAELAGRKIPVAIGSEKSKQLEHKAA